MDELLKQILGAQGSTGSQRRQSGKRSQRSQPSQSGGSLGDILGGLLGGGSGGVGGMAAMLPILLPLLLKMLGGGSGGQTGMHKLLDNMQANGLGDVADSWVGPGPGKTITPAQAKKIVGPDKVKELAAQSGLPADQVAQGLATILPGVVNHLTPDGQVPAANQVQSAISGILGSLGL
jgi:uncharacterized protein YidB (DUF937 family)